MLTDTHTHLYVEQFDEDRAEVMQRAFDSGVSRFVLPAIDSTYTERMRTLKQSYPEAVYLMCGLHPTHVKEDYAKELIHVEKELRTGQYVGVGEIGIDLYWDKSRLEQQIDAFGKQIRMSRTHGLPIVIHCREAFDEIFRVLEAEYFAELKGIFHCFTGTLEQAEKAISLGMHLGIGGVVTFKNGRIDQYLDQIPLKHIVLETDAPYLAPSPYRGKRNEPSYLQYVVGRLSQIYGLPEEEIARRTTANAKVVFGALGN